MRFRKKKEEEPVLVLTSLTDIFFLILIFLMCTSHFHVATDVPISLPKVVQKGHDKRDHAVILIIDKTGATYIKGERIDLKDLGARLKDLMDKEGLSSLVLQADEDVRHGRVVEVMDLAKSIGIPSILIAAQLEQKKAY
ncbi:putative Biopolymer transport protein exbD2 [uncultured Desulfobacterium sp.]|uniref:Putative Biopolymer transport protein exbD2 n=1 Tax=uncultured Desulfobacterium sp. TaxID=201089 RepID=A0A445N012_9BACT|nr:putative Biopolymer transport protein exbD2 [uncultured Desulfobacterium sp.]